MSLKTSSDRFDALQHHRARAADKPANIYQRSSPLHFPRPIGDDIQVAVGVGSLMVRGWWNDLIAEAQRTRHGLKGPAAANGFPVTP